MRLPRRPLLNPPFPEPNPQNAHLLPTSNKGRAARKNQSHDSQSEQKLTL
jgi:hypothetical protein